MIRVFVKVDGANAPLVAEHFEFEALPRIGDEVVVELKESQYLLKVEGVIHFANFQGTVTNLNSPILHCKMLGLFDLVWGSTDD